MSDWSGIMLWIRSADRIEVEISDRIRRWRYGR
jgi:hypothetical protein